MSVLGEAEAILWQIQADRSAANRADETSMPQLTEIQEADTMSEASHQVEVPACRRAFYQHFVSQLPKKQFESLREAEQYIKDHLMLLLEFYDHQPAALGLSSSPSTPVAIYDAWEYIFQLGWLRFIPNSSEVELVPILA